jgi:hypothetical protein
MTDDVAAAVEELRQQFPGATVTAAPDTQGGAHVTVEPVDPGERYVQRETWIKFHITFQYPYSDVYPHFVRSDLARSDGAVLGEGMSVGHFGDDVGPAVQISRRSNRLNPSVDTAALKLVKVLDWLRSR